MATDNDPLQSAIDRLGKGGAAPSAAISLTPEQLEAIVTAGVTKALKTMAPRVAPAPTSPHITCKVCGHKGIPTDDGTCPNNNCPRHTDGAIVGLHPSEGTPMYDADAHKAALEEHLAAAVG